MYDDQTTEIIIIGKKIKHGKMKLHNVSVAIHTDIGFSWFSVCVGKMLNKSTKKQLRCTASIKHQDIFSSNPCSVIKIITFGNVVAELVLDKIFLLYRKNCIQPVYAMLYKPMLENIKN